MSVEVIRPASTVSNGGGALNFNSPCGTLGQISGTANAFDIIGAATVHQSMDETPIELNDSDYIESSLAGTSTCVVKLGTIVGDIATGTYTVLLRARRSARSGTVFDSLFEGITLIFCERISDTEYELLRSITGPTGDPAEPAETLLTASFKTFTFTFSTANLTCAIADKSEICLFISGFGAEDSGSNIISRAQISRASASIPIDAGVPEEPVLVAPAGCSAFLLVGWRCAKLDWTDNSDDEDGFRIKRCLVNPCTPTTIDTVPAETETYDDDIDEDTVAPIPTGGDPLPPIPDPPTPCYVISPFNTNGESNSEIQCTELAQVVYNDVQAQCEPMDLPYNRVEEQDITVTGLSEGNTPTYTPVSGAASPTYTPVTS